MEVFLTNFNRDQSMVNYSMMQQIPVVLKSQTVRANNNHKQNRVVVGVSICAYCLHCTHFSVWQCRCFFLYWRTP